MTYLYYWEDAIMVNEEISEVLNTIMLNLSNNVSKVSGSYVSSSGKNFRITDFDVKQCVLIGSLKKQYLAEVLKSQLLEL